MSGIVGASPGTLGRGRGGKEVFDFGWTTGHEIGLDMGGIDCMDSMEGGLSVLTIYKELLYKTKIYRGVYRTIYS